MSDYSCTLNFYNRRMKSIRVVNSDEFLCYAKMTERRYFNTPNEYLITLRFILREFAFSKIQCSFVEVFHDGVFISRHYIRSFMLSPLVSYESDRDKDSLLREQQTAITPLLNWKKIISDSLWGKKPRGKPQDYLL